MSRPWAPVHPQHGADSSGGSGRAHAALGASFPGRGRPLAPVHLMGGAEELGIPQLRERHVRRTRSVNLSQSQSHTAAGGGSKKEKVGIPRKKKKKRMKGLSKSPESPLLETVKPLHFHRPGVVSEPQFGTSSAE